MPPATRALWRKCWKQANWPRTAGAALVLGLTLGGPVAGQNVVLNNDFDANVTSWTVESAAAASWSSADFAGNVGSGSAEVSNTSVGPNNGTGILQCLTVVGNDPFDLGGWVFVPSGQATSGTLQLGINFFASSDCTGVTVSTSTRATLPTTTTDVWTLLTTTAQTVPASANSGAFLAFPSKVEAGGVLTGRFDRLFFGPPGTTPVELMAFSVD